MKPSQLFFLMVVVLAMVGQTSEAKMSYPQPLGDITLQGHLNRSCIPHRGGTVYMQMELDARNFPLPDRPYRPMNIAVVLDRSGSMGDERKMDYAKKAVYSLIDRLSTYDYLSIVIYDERIETLFPSQRVTDKSRVKRLVENVYPRGSTNLGGGMEEGFRQIEEHFKRECINRVILLSDGLANQGITDPQELNRIASRYRNQSISLSTLGVGLDYNENLMLGLAEHGGGNYYFVESPSQLASIFERELNGLANVVAQNAHIELVLASGVSVNDVIGCERNYDDGKWIIPVGDIYANDRREFTVELTIPEGSGTKHVATGTLRVSGDHGLFHKPPSFSVSIRYSDDVAELDKGKDWDTQAKVDVAVSTRKVDQAMQALDTGNREDAERQINEAKAMLQSSPAMINSEVGAPMMKEQLQQLDKYSSDMKDVSQDARKVKKSMQYRNYQTQKKK
ncbi:MAG: VWA domain-containing protein [Ignavibacteria bacterium]|nr:VWA domain-containing protein [Ignavibacteria bacterium]MBI3765467.1 VWA domain-containing protein [Ignavibacteriales bacterium]